MDCVGKGQQRQRDHQETGEDAVIGYMPEKDICIIDLISHAESHGLVSASMIGSAVIELTCKRVVRRFF